MNPGYLNDDSIDHYQVKENNEEGIDFNMFHEESVSSLNHYDMTRISENHHLRLINSNSPRHTHEDFHDNNYRLTHYNFDEEELRNQSNVYAERSFSNVSQENTDRRSVMNLLNNNRVMIDRNPLGLGGVLNNHKLEINKLDELFDSLIQELVNEKLKLKNEKIQLAAKKQKFFSKMMKKRQMLERDKTQIEFNYAKAQSLMFDASSIINLDIGGTHKITTSRKTLCKYKDSALSAMFSNNNVELQSHGGNFFIDRDGETFMKVISFLRNDEIPYFDSKADEILFYEELEYWVITRENYDDYYSLLKFDEEWCANTLRLANKGTIIDKHGSQHGIVFTKFYLCSKYPYIEFKIDMKIPSCGTSHLFLGFLDKSKYSLENLTSSFWKDSPSSYYWDIWSNKLIKTDENGVQIGTKSNYGCFCENDSEIGTVLGIMYDAEKKNVSFYKNGINQGVAFQGVRENLTVSLDIWFEFGTVEIIRTNKPRLNSCINC